MSQKTEFNSFDPETRAKLLELGKHMSRAKAGIEKRKTEIYDKYDRPFEVNSHVWLWRNNISFSVALVDAMIDVLTPLDTGSELERWRTISPIHQIISRVFMSLTIAKRRNISVSDIEVELSNNHRVEPDRKTIKKVLDDGFDVGLLTRTGDNRHMYSMTLVMKEQLYERLVAKITMPSLVKLSKMVLTYHSMTEIALETVAREESGTQDFDPYRAVPEMLNYGAYDDAINALLSLEELNQGEKFRVV